MVTKIVSVIIVNYNAGELLTECVSRLLKSNIDLDIFISDNGSTDKSIENLKNNFSNVNNLFIKKNNVNLGFSAGNNAVYNQISTPYILYLNPDCLVEPDTIQILVQTMESFPRAAVVSCLVKNPDGTEQVGCRGLTPTPQRVLSQSFKLFKLFPKNRDFSGYLLSNTPLPSHAIEVELISGACMFIRKAAIEDVGLLDEKYFLYCEDYDWIYRFLSKNWKIIFTPETSVTHIKSHCAKRIPFRVLWYKTKGMWRYHNKFFHKKTYFFNSLIIKVGIITRFLLMTVLTFFRRLI